MTEPSPALRRRLDLFRHRRATTAADRAAFEARRKRGLTARQQAKLAYLAESEATQDIPDDTEDQEVADNNRKDDAA